VRAHRVLLRAVGLAGNITCRLAPQETAPGIGVGRSIVPRRTFQLSLHGVTPGDDLTILVEMAGGTESPVNPQSAFVDNFRLTLVPEPSTLWLAWTTLVGVAIWWGTRRWGTKWWGRR